MNSRRFRPWAMLAMLLTAFALVATAADARIGGGRSMGSRGERTYTTPPATRTAPNAASPFQRTITQPSPGFNRPSTSPLGGGFFGRPGFFGGLAAGFFGAGLLGLLFGHGLFGGLHGFGSIFGLLLQIVIVVFVARLIWGWWQRRNQPAYAQASDGSSYGYARDNYGAGYSTGGEGPPSGQPIEIGKSDYDSFERLLGQIQLAYGREDLNALHQWVTPEMLSYFSEDLSDNASRGIVNQVSDVRLVQGDLSEAWREGSTEYATVAMTFSLIDVTVERASGRIIDGDPANPVQVTELWTFRRVAGGQWLLSAIQQTE